MPYPTFSPNASTANILNDASSNSFVIHDVNEAQRQYLISRVPFIARDVLLAKGYPLTFDLPGRTSFVMERPVRAALTIALSAAISNYGAITLTPATLAAGSATALAVNGYSTTYPYRFFSAALGTDTTDPTVTLTPISGRNGNTLADFTISATGGANWLAGDLIAVGDPYFNGGVLRVLTVSGGAVATVAVVNPGKNYNVPKVRTAIDVSATNGTAVALPEGQSSTNYAALSCIIDGQPDRTGVFNVYTKANNATYSSSNTQIYEVTPPTAVNAVGGGAKTIIIPGELLGGTNLNNLTFTYTQVAGTAVTQPSVHAAYISLSAMRV